LHVPRYLEEREDYLKGIAALERREPTITLEELERRLGFSR
jgi:Mn-dependent DtxR family transcriptional regulator